MTLIDIKKTSTPKIIFFGILLVQLVAMLIMSQDAGISADENRHIRQAAKVYNYYQTDGEDKSALEKTGVDPMQYNGQSFDNVMYVLTQKFDVENYIEMRHFFLAIISWLIILLTGLIVKKSFGYEGAILAIILLFISPRFIGHALNNNKDIPFALGFTLSIYGMTRFFSNLPKIKVWDIVFMTLGIGIAISIRLAGILSIAFLGVFSAIYFIIQRPYFKPFQKQKLDILKKLAITVPLIAVAGYFIGIAYWPFMMEDPIKNIKVVMEATSSHPVSLSQLFDGEIIMSNKIPSDYVLTYLTITYPIFILLGLILSLVLAPIKLKKDKFFNFFIITFSYVFVMVWMSVKTSNYYGGIRHLLFVYPMAVAMAVYGFLFVKDLFKNSEKKWMQFIPYGFIALLSLGPVIHLIKNYPYSYVYFNELSGGVKKAATKYETDYFQHSLRHATEWFVENELKNLPEDSSKVNVISNDNFNTGYYLKDYSEKISFDYTRYYEKAKQNWDYAIFYCGYIAPNQIANGQWPPKGTIHTETVDGFPIAAVVKRISTEDIEGFDELKKGKAKEARVHFSKYLEFDPSNEEILEAMAQTYMMERDFDSTVVYANKAIESNPRQIGAWMLKTSALNSKKDFQSALETANGMLEVKDDYAEAHYQKGYALKGLNRANDALKEFQIAVAYNDKYYTAYYQAAEILSQYKNYQKAIEVYTTVLEKKPDDFVSKAFMARNYYLSGNESKANEIIEAIPQNYTNRLELVALKCRQALDKNDLRTSAQYLNAARRINNNSDLFVLRARFSLLANNNKVEAQDYLNKAVELDPINREARELLNSIQNNQVADQTSKTNTPQESIMFQKQEEKKTSPLTIPGN